ncbi:MAG: hypothetical protein R3E10_08310 [Gemmatimonadota bacterium]
MLDPRAGLFLLATLALASPQVAGAQARSRGDQCTDPIILQGLSRLAQSSTPLLYDGVADLRRQPATPVSFSATPGCVLLSAQLVERGGQYSVESAAPVAVSGPMRDRSRVVPPMVAAATQVLRELINQDVFPRAPDGTGRYAVAVPLNTAHALYQGHPTVTPRVAPDVSDAPRTLADRGFPDARLLSARPGLAVYQLAERGEWLYLAVVRDIAPNEPILDFQDAQGRSGTVQRYGSVTRRRFLEEIVPLIRSSTRRAQAVDVWTYATDVHVPSPAESSFAFARARHPVTGRDDVEMPIQIESWQGIRRSAAEPFSWDDRNSMGVRGARTNTIAAIQALYERDEVRAEAARQVLAERDAQEDADRRERAAERAAHEVLKSRAYAAAGLDYREDGYWQRYRMAAEIRAIHEGEFPGARQAWEFGRIYKFVIGNYSARCRSYIPRVGAFIWIQTWTRRDPNGWEWITDQDTTYVHPDFIQPYRWWDEDSPLALVDVPSGLTDPDALGPNRSGQVGGLEAVALLTRTSVALRQDMDVLFDGGCENPILDQVMENMRRLALFLPTLQAEHVPEALPDPARPTLTFGESCERYIDDGGFLVDRDWCPCLEEVLVPKTTIGERWGYIGDYIRFWRRVHDVPDGGPDDPDWALYEPANACRR